MKIALVIRRFVPIGGAERACANLAKGLLARGHEVHVLSQKVQPIPGITPRQVPPDGFTASSGFDANCRKILDKEPFDIVHSFTRTTRQDILRLGGGIHKEFLLRTDPTYSAIGRFFRRLRPKQRHELKLEEEGLQKGTLVAVSNRVRDETILHYDVDPKRIRVIYNGVDLEEFKPNPEARHNVRLLWDMIEENDYVLIFSGTGFRRKGLATAVAAIDRNPRAFLVVAGDGPRSMHPRVIFLGRRVDINHIYAAADALILPTLYDPFPNAALEAMACGIPAIISRVAGVSEIIDGDSIVVDKARDVDGFAGAVRRLEDPEIRKPMGEAARKKAEQFTLQRNLDANLALYDELAPKSGNP